MDGNKYFVKETLELPFLLSTEDTAFDMTLLKECSNLLIVGAVSFSTFSTAYNCRFGYRKVEVNEGVKSKRLKRYVTRTCYVVSFISNWGQ